MVSALTPLAVLLLLLPVAAGLDARPEWTPVPDPDEVTVPEKSSTFQVGLLICPCSPTKRGTVPEAQKILNELRQQIDEHTGQQTSGIGHTGARDLEALKTKLKREVIDCVKEYTMEACVNADVKTRGSGLVSMCSYSTKSGKNLYQNSTVFDKNYRTAGGCDLADAYNLTEVARNEGCVAVEHLEGYELQHPRDLRREVLCARGFCATPNHAIIVGGEYTSMRRLCGGVWTGECTKSVKLVNNLKIAANRRAVVGDIVVTPYDIRFPIWLIWVVQILEDVWNVLALSVCTGTLASVAVLLLSRAESKAAVPLS